MFHIDVLSAFFADSDFMTFPRPILWLPSRTLPPPLLLQLDWVSLLRTVVATLGHTLLLTRDLDQQSVPLLFPGGVFQGQFISGDVFTCQHSAVVFVIFRPLALIGPRSHPPRHRPRLGRSLGVRQKTPHLLLPLL